MANEVRRKWESSQDLIDEIHALYGELRAGSVNVEDARVLGNLLKQGVKVVELEVSTARMTGRLKDGQNTVPGFKRGKG